MKGEREKYDDLRPDESYLDFFKRHTHKSTYHHYQCAYNHLTDFMEEKSIDSLENIDDPEAEEFCEYLKEICKSSSSDLGQETAEGYVGHLSSMCSWIVSNTNYLDYDVFSDAADEVGFEYDDRDTKKRDVEIDDLRQAVRNARRPTVLTLLMVLLKTGLRVGEAVNLRYKDINLNHPISEMMPQPRNEIRGMPDSLYVDSSRSGSKDRSYREVPIDQELKRVLIWYIAMTPPSTGSTSPLLVDLQAPDSTYGGLASQTAIDMITEWSKQQNLWEEAKSNVNVTSHWCRHWWTTTLRANVDDDEVPVGNAEEFIQGLRGDSDDGIIDTYTHEWESMQDDGGPTYEELYYESLPDLLVEPEEPKEVENDEIWNDLSELTKRVADVNTSVE